MANIVDFANLIKNYTKKMVQWGDQSKGYVGKNKWTTDGAIGSGTGISFTRNSNGTVDVSAGTTTSECIYPTSQTLIYDDGSLEKSKDYIVSYGNTTHIDWVYIQVFKKTTSSSSWEKIAETSISASLTFTVPSTFYCLWVRFLFANGKSFSATTLYPMIRLASIPDSTYEPWYMTNRELTEQVNDLTSTKISGKKVSGTVSGSSVTFTDADLTSDSIIDGPYVGGMVMRIDSVTPSIGSVTFTFTSSSASGQTAYIWIR